MPSVDQDFFDMFNPTFEFTILGHPFIARPLGIAEFEALKVKFPKWRGFDVAELLRQFEFEALVQICWLGVKGLNEQLEHDGYVRSMINVTTFAEWAPVWRQMAGLEPEETAAAMGEDVPPTETEESSKTGDTSAP